MTTTLRLIAAPKAHTWVAPTPKRPTGPRSRCNAFAFPERGFSQAVRLGNWKAVRPKPAAALELYDLATDLGEAHNVATDHADVLAKIESILVSVRTESKRWPMKAKSVSP